MWSNDVGEQAQSACFSPDGEVRVVLDISTYLHIYYLHIYVSTIYYLHIYYLYPGDRGGHRDRQVGGPQQQHQGGVQRQPGEEYLETLS